MAIGNQLPNHFLRLLDVLLPSGGGVMVLVEGYFDESGDFAIAPHYFCVAGYFIESSAARKMDKEWKRVLDEHSIPYFHMVDCAHGNGIFANKTDDENDEIARKFIKLIKEYTSEGFAIIINKDDFEYVVDFDNEYTFGVDVVVNALKQFTERVYGDGEIAYFFEAGHNSRGHAYNKIASEIGTTAVSISFLKKTQARLLEAADLLAWQSVKYWKDRRSNVRQPRKDFLSLMEHHHTFWFPMMFAGGSRQWAVEMWPRAKMFTAPTFITTNTDGPISLYFEGGEERPIVPVGRPIGYRLGTDDQVYIYFQNGWDQREFILGFTEHCLLNAAKTLLVAAGIFEDSEQTLTVSIERSELVVRGDEALMLVKIHEGGRLAFELPKKILQYLKDVLRNG